ncbi:MAG: vanadium-dependent haloperoxidase [Bacteroidota bacterium]
MKQTLSKLMYLLFTLTAVFYFAGCQKNPPALSERNKMITDELIADGSLSGHLQQTKTFSSEVIIKWLNQQLDMLRVPLAPGTGSQAAERALAYCGIAAYESVVPGMPAYKSLQGQLTDFPAMPSTEPGKAYHWAASANAALATINRLLFPATSDANKTNMNTLESTLQSQYATESDAQTIARSVNFGREVANRVFQWASTDGSANANPSYVPTPGPGLWESTPPNFPAAVNPYASQRRLMFNGVADGTAIAAPPPYSTDPSSPFYAMVKDVYDKSQSLTAEQTAMVIYHRDAPGYPGGGHFVAILSQVLSQAQSKLDIAALAYVKTGMATYNAITICFTLKYSYNLVRPITYIRNVMGYTSWSALFNTPGHPEFPAAHAVNGATIAKMLTSVFGDNFQFTLHTYDYLGLPARSYSSFYAMGKEMADSRVFGGVHYQASCDKGRQLGERVSQNILSGIEFLKD